MRGSWKAPRMPCFLLLHNIFMHPPASHTSYMRCDTHQLSHSTQIHRGWDKNVSRNRHTSYMRCVRCDTHEHMQSSKLSTCVRHTQSVAQRAALLPALLIAARFTTRFTTRAHLRATHECIAQPVASRVSRVGTVLLLCVSICTFVPVKQVK